MHALTVDNQLKQLNLATSNLQVYSPELPTCSLYPVLVLRFHRIMHPQEGTTRITLRPLPDQEPNLPLPSLFQLKRSPRAPFARSPSPLMSGKAVTLKMSTIRKTRPMLSTSTLITLREDKMQLTVDSNKIREEKRHSCLEIIRERLRGARCEKGRQSGWLGLIREKIQRWSWS